MNRMDGKRWKMMVDDGRWEILRVDGGRWEKLKEEGRFCEICKILGATPHPLKPT